MHDEKCHKRSTRKFLRMIDLQPTNESLVLLWCPCLIKPKWHEPNTGFHLWSAIALENKENYEKQGWRIKDIFEICCATNRFHNTMNEKLIQELQEHTTYKVFRSPSVNAYYWSFASTIIKTICLNQTIYTKITCLCVDTLCWNINVRTVKKWMPWQKKPE